MRDEKQWKAREAVYYALSWLGEEGNQTVRKINEGGQGEIYYLESEKHPYPLTIKVPLYNEERRMEKAESLILRDGREMWYASQLLPEYFPQVLVYEESGRFLIREYRPGDMLWEYLRKGGIPDRQLFFHKVTELMEQICDIYHDHPEEPRVFRDFRGGNMVVDPESKRLSLIDCGSVRKEKQNVRKGYHKNLSDLGSGTYTNLPPEQLMDQRELLDRRVDFFSYGITVYYILFLENAYTNRIADVAEAWEQYHKEYAHAVEKIRTSEETKGIAPVLLEQMIGCLHPDVHKRFSGKLITEE